MTDFVIVRVFKITMINILRSPMEKVGNMQENMGHVSRGFLLNTLQIDIKNINFRCYIEL